VGDTIPVRFAETGLQELTVAAIYDDGDMAGSYVVGNAVLEANVADQFERGRSRALAPGQDPRPKYWEHYLEFYRVLTQGGTDGLPHQFTEMFQRAYTKAREELRNRRRGE